MFENGYHCILVVSRTPVRISFFGGGTDYPEYYLRKRGAVLGTSINKYTHISLSNKDPFFDHKYRIAYSRTELVSHIDEIQHPSVRECLRKREIEDYLDIHIFSDLPAKTGLGSSSSFTVGFLNLLSAFEGRYIRPNDLAQEACLVEQNLINENVGSQDQFHATIGGLNIYEFSEKGITHRPLYISSVSRKLLESSLMLFYTGITRFASQVVAEQVDRTKKLTNDEYLETMHKMVFDFEHIVSEQSDDVLLRSFGSMLDESWKMKKQLSSSVSNQEIDTSYEKAIAAGAYGGKLCGAGGGGFLLLVVPQEKQKAVKGAIGLMQVQFSFEDEGSKIIYMKEG